MGECNCLRLTVASCSSYLHLSTRRRCYGGASAANITAGVDATCLVTTGLGTAASATTTGFECPLFTTSTAAVESTTCAAAARVGATTTTAARMGSAEFTVFAGMGTSTA